MSKDATALRLSPALPEHVELPPDSMRLEGWFDQTYFSGTADSVKPWRARGVVGRVEHYQIGEEFRSALADWFYEQHGERAVFRVTYELDEEPVEWAHEGWALDEDDCGILWECIREYVGTWRSDWRWHTKISRFQSYMRALEGEAEQRGIPKELLLRLCEQYRVAVHNGGDAGLLVDAIALDKALASAVEFSVLPYEATPRQVPSDTIYFFRAQSTGLIKIGVTNNVKARARAIGTMGADVITVLATMPGTHSDERDLHKRFAAHRKHGEWFAPCEELLEFIRSIGGRRRR